MASLAFVIGWSLVGVGGGYVLNKAFAPVRTMEDGEKPMQKSVSMFDFVIILILSVLFFQLGMYMLDAKGA